MSSSSSDYSGEDLEALRPIAAALSAPNLDQVVELAQICSFCTTFRQPLRLPSFSRTDLQKAILSAPNGDTTHVELLAELHFKLAREHPSAKMEKMVEAWEKTLARKLQDNWRKEFTANPMAGGMTYGDLTVFERVKILDALCHWKLDTCAEIQKHVAALQKDNDSEAIERLRAGKIGMDDKGVSYWYLYDGCWIYAEDKSRRPLKEYEQSYMVEFASAKRIRLSINFDPDQNSSAPPPRLPDKKVDFADIIGEQVVEKMATGQSQSKLTIYHGGISSERDTLESREDAAEVVKVGEKELNDGYFPTRSSAIHVRYDTLPAEESLTARRMDINVLCTSFSPTSDEVNRNRERLSAGFHQSNGLNESLQNRNDENVIKLDGVADVSAATVALHRPQTDKGASFCDENYKESLAPHEKAGRSPKKENVGKIHDSVPVQSLSCLVAVVGSKMRKIVDDDSSSSEFETVERLPGSTVDRQAAVFSPLKANSTAETACAEQFKDQKNTHVNGSSIFQDSECDSVVIGASTAVIMGKPEPTIKKKISPSKAKIDAEMKKKLSLVATKSEKIKVVCNGIECSTTGVKNTRDAAREVKLLRSALKSSTNPDTAPELFNITCESCKKCYDMRYVDPPLLERPTEEWRCFECLVNDARGWPRRRKPVIREIFSPRGFNLSSRKRSLSSKSSSGLSSLTGTARSSSNSRPSLSSEMKSSHSNCSKRKSMSSSKSRSSKKSSFSKKRKKRKSSHHRHSSNGHRQRHHMTFARLLALYHERQEQRLGIEGARITGHLQAINDDAPQGWRVVSSTLNELQALIVSLSGGSLEQDRLRGRLILILKDQEKFDEQQRKQKELAWNILPRRQSSRIAIGRMKNQSAHEIDMEDKCSDDDGECRRLRLRWGRSHFATSNGVDKKQKQDRAWRARRRYDGSDDEVEDKVDGTVVGDWIDWSLAKRNARSLSTVCLALVSRLLKEETADLFSRPVSPDLDGCPNYLSVITRPMDLGTIRSRVENNYYREWNLFKEDVELVWQNCRAFNAPDTLVVQFANELSKLSRFMCIAAENKGVDRLKDSTSGVVNDSDNHLSDVSKAESHSSISKAWTESSASESSDLSDGNSFAAGDSNSNTQSRERRNMRTSSKKPSTRIRISRSTRTRSPANYQSRPIGSSRKRPVPAISSEGEIFAPVQKNRRSVQKPPLNGKYQVEPATEDEGSIGGHSTTGQNGTPSISPPPPPPQQVAQKRPKPRLIISDSSSSDDSSDSGNSSTSSSSDSYDSDSDARSKHHKPPPPSTAEALTPAPPPPAQSPAASPLDSRSPVRASLNKDTKLNTGASQDGTTIAPSTAKPDASHSPPLLNSYLSSTSSSSSDFSSNDSDSSNDESESD